MRSTNRMSRRQGGFSLIELMVGMTIGLLAGIIIIQVMTLFEAQRRSTTGSADAQTNGGIALYAISRELQMAGYPLIPTTDSALECTTVTYGATGITGITPVVIVDGVATGTVSASDTITIRFGDSEMGGTTTPINGGPTAGVVPVRTSLGCRTHDATRPEATLISNGATCALSTVTAKSDAAGANTVSLADTTGAASGANLACLGTWNEVTYAINPATGNMDRTIVQNGVSVTTPSVVGVVNIQAQYGISASANSNQVTAWVDPSGGTWAAPTLANRNRIKAVRIAVIARNAKIETAAVSTACSSTTAAAPTGVCAWAGTAASPAPTVDLSPGDANWARYRYRVFETIIPLRNVIWSKDTL